MFVRASSCRTTSRLGASMTSLSAPPASMGTRTAPPPMVKLVTRSGALAAKNNAAAVPTSGPTTCGAPRPHCSMRRARNVPIASGAISAGRPSEWPKPGRSIATARATPDTRSQIRRYAQRLSGHGLNINTVTADESALLSANRIRTPSHTRKSGVMGKYPAAFIVVVSRSLCLLNATYSPLLHVVSSRHRVDGSSSREPQLRPIHDNRSIRPGAARAKRALRTRSFRSGRKPAVEVVENRFDSRPQLVGDLVLALTLAGAPSRLADDDLEDAGERDSLQPGNLCGCIADRVGDGVG